jgi:hypothetical protein
MFPVKPFHKTHVNLCKSCSLMVHLQLLYLAILNFYSNLPRLNHLKTCWPNKNRRSSALKRRSRPGAQHHTTRQALYVAVPGLPNREYGKDADHIIAHPQVQLNHTEEFPLRCVAHTPAPLPSPVVPCRPSSRQHRVVAGVLHLHMPKPSWRRLEVLLPSPASPRL